MNLNNPISIFANDVKPLRPSLQGVDGLDDKLNTQTFISDEIIRVTEEGSIGYANVSHNLEVMYAMKLICGTYSLLSSMPFGLISQYMYCDDRIHQNFVVSNMYHIDASDGHQELIPGRVEVTNRVIVVRRSVRTGLPLVGSFSVQKDLRSEVCTALKAFCEELKTNRMERLALGLAETNEYDNPKLLILRNMIANFFANVKLNVKFCSSGQVRGTNAKILRRLIQYSPSVYSLMRVKPHKQVTLKAADLAVTLNSSVADLAFGLNKPIPYTHYGSADAGAEQKEALIKLLNLYDQYTDNDGALDDMHGYLTGPGAPFNKPTAVVITTGRVIDMLSHVGVVKTTTCTVVQKIAEISLSSADMSPMVTAAPQKAVNLVNGQYTFDPSGQIKRKEISTEDQTVLYSKLGNHNLMFCAVEPSLFTNNILREAQMESMTTFDSIIPTGVILCEGDCTEIPKGPSQQVTHFCNEFSTQYTLKCSSMAGILRALFVDGGKAFFSFKQGIDDIEDSSAYEKSMVFYRYRGELFNEDGTPTPSQFQAESGDDSEMRGGLNVDTDRINVPDNESTGVKIVDGAVGDNANETGGDDRAEAGGSGENDAVEPGAEEAGTEEAGAEEAGAEEAGVRATDPSLSEAVTAQKRDRVKDNYSVLKTTVSINKYMVDNYYYSHAVHVNNIISVILNSAAASLKDLLVAVTAFEKENRLTFDEDMIPEDVMSPLPRLENVDIIETEMGGWRLNFFNVTMIIAAVEEYIGKLRMVLPSKLRIYAIHKVLFELTNKQAVEFLSHINMGFGILWINPQEVISDSVLIARPSGVCNLTGRPTVGRDMSHADESQYDKYTTQTHTAVGRMSLGTHPGIFWHNASYVKSNHTMDDKTVPFYSKTKLKNVISWLNERAGGSHETPTSTSTTADGWWPVFCPPTLPKSFFESANSPVGRLNTHYSTVEEFSHMFCNRNINDIKFPSTFTVNPVFTHPFANINSECLYPSVFLNEPGFPLTKYLTFNRTAALAAANMSNAMSKSIKDIFNERIKENADDDNDGIINYLGMTHNNISHLTGAALPKPCWTTMDLSAGLMSRDDFKDAKMYAKTSVVTNGDTGFYITGTHAQGRFERRNVSHFRYPL